MVKTLSFQSRGHRSDASLGTKIPHTTRHGQRKAEKNKINKEGSQPIDHALISTNCVRLELPEADPSMTFTCK